MVILADLSYWELHSWTSASAQLLDNKLWMHLVGRSQLGSFAQRWIVGIGSGCSCQCGVLVIRHRSRNTPGAGLGSHPTLVDFGAFGQRELWLRSIGHSVYIRCELRRRETRDHPQVRSIANRFPEPQYLSILRLL